jgi:ribonuclease P protein component
LPKGFLCTTTQTVSGGVFGLRAGMSAHYPNTFGYFSRIHESDSYKSALSSRPVGRSKHFFVHSVAPGSLSLAQLGLIVPKRLLKKATARNTIKRLIRESFRVTQHRLAARAWVVRLRLSPEPSSNSVMKTLLRAELDNLFTELSKA